MTEELGYKDWLIQNPGGDFDGWIKYITTLRFQKAQERYPDQPIMDNLPFAHERLEKGAKPPPQLTPEDEANLIIEKILSNPNTLPALIGAVGFTGMYFLAMNKQVFIELIRAGGSIVPDSLEADIL